MSFFRSNPNTRRSSSNILMYLLSPISKIASPDVGATMMCQQIHMDSIICPFPVDKQDAYTAESRHQASVAKPRIPKPASLG
jgi:hypothetical protein